MVLVHGSGRNFSLFSTFSFCRAQRDYVFDHLEKIPTNHTIDILHSRLRKHDLATLRVRDADRLLLLQHNGHQYRSSSHHFQTRLGYLSHLDSDLSNVRTKKNGN